MICVIKLSCDIVTVIISQISVDTALIAKLCPTEVISEARHCENSGTDRRNEILKLGAYLVTKVEL